jgi:methanogenic corrinoid protein MtbC1
LTQGGHSIGSVARLSLEELRALFGQMQLSEASANFLAPTSRPASTPFSDEFIVQFVEEALVAICKLNDVALENLLNRAAGELGQPELLQTAIAPLVQRIGDQWESGRLQVVHEHFASSVLRTFLGNAAKPSSLPESAPILVVATPVGQLHELGAVLVAAIASNKGWRVKYLGTNLSAADISMAAIQCQARAVGLSLVYPAHDPHLPAELLALRNSLPAEMPLLIGGRAAASYMDTLVSIRALLLTEIPLLCRKLDELRGEAPFARLRGME